MHFSERVATPNDLKLSDCGARRAGCGKAAGVGWAKAAGWSAAASVTRGAVRCSAWFGDVGLRTDARKVLCKPTPGLAMDAPNRVL